MRNRTSLGKGNIGIVRDYITGYEIKNTTVNLEVKIPIEQRLVEEYGYKKTDIEIDFPMRTNSFFDEIVDLVVFEEGKPHLQSNAFIVIEVKKQNRKQGVQQLKTYFTSSKNVKFGVWFNGSEILYLKKLNKPPFWKEVFNIPKRGETLGLPKKKDLKEAHDLNKVFGLIHNHIYANDGLSSLEAFYEVLKLLFIKMEDDKNDSDTVRFGISEEEYDQVIYGKPNKFRSRIESLFERAKKDYYDVFSEHDQLNLKTSTLAFVVGQLQNYDLKNSKTDVKGSAFQKFVYAHHRGERGQFFTPYPIVDLIVKVLDPKPHESILDPACGTAGFLVKSMKDIWSKVLVNIKNSSGSRKKKLSYTINNLRGIEINPSLARVAKMRMLLEDDGFSGILNIDALVDWNTITKAAKERRIKNFGKQSFDLIMTNPPFGSQGKITDKKFLERFNFGYRWVRKDGKWYKTNDLLNGQVPDILFIERCLDFLKPGGRLGIVLPDGDLENSSLGHIRQYIKENTKILAVISLPQKTFIPHGTGVKASVLFLEKLSKHEKQVSSGKDYPIFFGIIENIGYEGNRNGTPIYIRDAQGELVLDELDKPILKEDITEISDQFHRLKKGQQVVSSPRIFTRNLSELENRLDAEFYKLEYKALKDRLMKVGAQLLKEIVQIISQKSLVLKQANDIIKYIELSDVNPPFSEIISYKEMPVFEAPSRASYEIKEGDIITAVSGNSTGTISHATAYVTKEFDGFICTNGFRVLRPIDINPFYLLYFLRSNNFLLQMFQYRTGATIPAVSDEDLGRILVLVPPKKDQERIAEQVQKSYKLRSQALRLLKDSDIVLKEYLKY